MIQPQSKVELHLPNELGYEKVAIVSIAKAAQKAGFCREKIEDLKSALAEACTNAIEHGNSLNAQARLSIVCTVYSDSIQVSVIDEGHQPIPISPPDRSERSDHRGMGLHLMPKLVDKFEIKSQPGRNEVQMTNFLNTRPLPALR
ncbi:MAG: ATP-binding protein [Anaerolineae bacterium]|nr:ATP-binding protein [Anaerolineae bacterium]